MIISVHFPKASGSSLRSQFLTAFGERLISDYEHDPLGPKAREVAEILPQGARAVHGHFRPHRYDQVPHAFRLTFLREPVDNLISFYFYWRDIPLHGNPVHVKFMEEKPSIVDFARYCGIQTLMSETYFGGYDMNQFSFIGFYDRRAEDLPKLGNLIGVALDPQTYENKTPGGKEERLQLLSDSAALGELRSALRQDICFYEALRGRAG
jgi:hypothetical protein